MSLAHKVPIEKAQHYPTIYEPEWMAHDEEIKISPYLTYYESIYIQNDALPEPLLDVLQHTKIFGCFWAIKQTTREMVQKSH